MQTNVRQNCNQVMESYEAMGAHFLDEAEDAVNTAMGRHPTGLGEALCAVGSVGEIMKGLAYIVGTLEIEYRSLAGAGHRLRFQPYPGEPNQTTDDARDELLRLLAAVRTQLENSTVPTVERVTYLAARLRESPQTRRP